jgi:hypothetical protein
MNRILITLLAISIAFVLTPRRAAAHHGWAEFDSAREVTLEGTVTDFHFINPHCVVEFDSRDEKGQTHNWQGEFSSPGPLSRKGWTAASLQVGMKIKITGNPAWKGIRALHVTRIHLSTGEDLPVPDGR